MENDLEYDVTNAYEAISILLQYSFNILLLTRGIVNILNIPRWRKEKNIKVDKLYCINVNCIVVIISNTIKKKKIELY